MLPSRRFSREFRDDMDAGSNVGSVLKTPVMPLGRILVVDDNPDNVEIIATRLRFRGYEIIEATNGETALNSDSVRQTGSDSARCHAPGH